MLGYIPRAVQLKLFRYALSKLDFLDHSTYDVERDFNLSLGLKNELEMKNLGLNVAKLSTTLNLPPNVRLRDARVSTLHIRIPTDFHRAPVKVSISTVIVDGEILSDVGTEDPPCELKSNTFSTSNLAQDLDIRDGFKIPSGVDLTESFLQERPVEARKLGAILQSKAESREPLAENDSEEEDPVEDSGLGTPLSLWNFVPSFFQRLVDRVEIVVENISLRIRVSCLPAPSGLDIDPLVVTFSIDSIEIEGVSASPNVAKQDATVLRRTKPGMRAVRIDGIALSLSGYKDFFEDFPTSTPLNLGDTDTAASNSTVLPSDAIPVGSAAVDNTEMETELPPLGVSNSNSLYQNIESSEDPRVVNRRFFAQMQEPHRNYTQTPPSPPTGTSQHVLFSPISSFHGSIGPEETLSETLSQSLLDTENNTIFSERSRNLGTPNIDDICGPGSLQDPGSFQRSMSSCLDEEKSDADSLENEPRQFDLFQEPNTKFLGVTATLPSRILSPESRLRTRTPPTELNIFEQPYSHIAEPVPRLAPAMTISQTLTNLELANASPGSADEYTYYEEPMDQVEYSNPDLLYLSQSVHSTASSASNNETQRRLGSESPEPSNVIGEPSFANTETKVIYASSDKGDLSDSGSVYESYPPSEADDPPSFVLGTPPLEKTNPEDSLTHSLSSKGPGGQAVTQTAKSAGSSARKPSPQMQIQIQTSLDHDQQKVPKDATILIQSQIPPPPLVLSQNLTPQIEDTDPQGQAMEESGSEGSESVLAESMIFTHEEAGSLYLSALGGSRSLGPPLPVLVEENETTPSTPFLARSASRTKIQKRVFQIDYIDIFVPGIAQSTDGLMGDRKFDATPTPDPMSESSCPAMPGAFSAYAATRPERKKTESSSILLHPNLLTPKPSVSFKLAEGDFPNTPHQHPSNKPQVSTPRNRIELEIGNIGATIDLIVGRKIATIFATVTIVGETSRPTRAQEPVKVDDIPKVNDFEIALSVASLNITLVDRIPEFIAPTGRCGTESEAPDPAMHKTPQTSPGSFNPLDILVLSVKRIKLGHRTNYITGTPGSCSEISLGSCSVNVGGQNVMKLVPNQKFVTSGKQKATVFEPVFLLRIEDNEEERLVHVQSAVVNFYFPIHDLEATLSRFGGLETMLNITPASSLPSKGQTLQNPGPLDTHEDQGGSPTTKQISITADIGGLNIEVFVSSLAGGVGLSTSPIKITTSETGGLTAKLNQLAIFGPNSEESGGFKSAIPIIESKSINLTLDSSPTEEDLERLLKMIIPSTDGYDDDDGNVMVDILLRQRRQGSVLRVDIGEMKGRLSNLRDISRFKAVAEELAKMATVAKYIPQDERPGMLTLLSVDSLSFAIFPDNEPHSFTAGLKNTDICHVATPSLFALSIRQVDLIRQPGQANEVWIGESLPHSLAIFNHKHKTRPMVKVRMIGDEPEPEIKIKIWNIRLEYHVESVFNLVSLATTGTPDVAATSMVGSGTKITNRETHSQFMAQDGIRDKPPPANLVPLRLNIGLSGVSIALNPLNSLSKALFIIHDGNFVCELSSHQPFSASLALLKANVVAIDNRNNLISPQIQLTDGRKQKHQPVEELCHYTSQGYVSVLTATSAKLSLKICDNDAEAETTMLVNVEDIFIFIESCADSTQTVIEILNGMKPPLPESEEIKYMTQIMPVDVFANLDENAFMPVEATFIDGQPRNLRSLEEMPEDLFDDEVPFNSQLIESYYPHSDLPSATPPSTSNSSRPGPINFHEQVCVVAEEPLTFDDQYIHTPTQEPQRIKVKTVPRKTALKLCVRNTQLIWNLHDGYDWQKTRDTISKAVKRVEERAFRRRRRHIDTQRGLEEEDEGDDEGDEESATYDVLFNSIYITLPQHRDPRELSQDIQNQIKGSYETQSETGSYAPSVTTVDSPYSSGPRNLPSRRRDQKYQRSKRNAMQFELKGVDVDFDIFEPDGLEIQTSLDLRINEVQVTENVRTSTWRMFLTYMREAGVRERGLPMAHIHVDTLRPIPELAATELSIKVKLLPLRLYVDQDALEFLTRFFEFKDPDTPKAGTKQEEPFIQRCEIDTVRVKLDFKPKRVDYAGLRSGRTTEFMNFFILEEADMELRHVALNGVSGFERLGKDLNNIWMPDIKQNQLGGVVAGVAPFRSLVNIGTGVRDLVKVPIMEYRKDGRLVRSIKKGTQHFVKTSGSEVARLGAKLAIGTQTFLERTEEFLVGDQVQQRQYSHLRENLSGEEDGEGTAAAFSPYADQPLGVYNGLVQARRGLTRNLNEAKEAIMRVPAEAAQGGSAKVSRTHVDFIDPVSANKVSKTHRELLLQSSALRQRQLFGQ
ncbi:autophagy- protein 2, variant 2 [Orbilia javanica]|uniref:Autophagy-related protein 2 n=1 Tax=Orbilia javanica TaxID=47235 RepID=A0AAN8N669_9PEZI